MNASFLIALKALLLAGLADLRFECRGLKGGEDEDPTRPVQVHIGDLPPKKRRPGTVDDLDDNFPCIVLVPVSGQWDQGEDAVTVAVVYGVYCGKEGDAEGAEMDHAVLLSRIKQSLFPCQGHPLEQRFRLTQDSKGRLFAWEKSDMQARPYVQGTLMTHWRMKGLE